jgi:hypothetical protein
MNQQHLAPRSTLEKGVPPGPAEIVAATHAPWLVDALAAREADLRPRVEARYTELCALPRATRRALQRRLARSRELTARLEAWLERGPGRTLQRQLARTLAGAALLLALGYGTGEAATIPVTTRTTAINADGQCSLIEAIVNANDDAATHADCPPGSGTDTIVLPGGTLVVTSVSDTTYGPTGLPLITSAITIEGNGASIIRKATAPAFRLVATSASGDLTLKNVEIRAGRADGYDSGGGAYSAGRLVLQGSVVSGNDAFAGGGIANYGTLVVDGSEVRGNEAQVAGGGILQDEGGANSTIVNSTISGNRTRGIITGGIPFGSLGGGLTGIAGTIQIQNSRISGNDARGYVSAGGGIANVDATLVVENSRISGNDASGRYYGAGGGLVNFGTGSTTVRYSTVAGNRAGTGTGFGVGGGIHNAEGTLLVERSTISGNDTLGAGPSYGGGIANYDTATIETSTISGNAANGEGVGGGIYNGGTLTVSNSTIARNLARSAYSYGGGIADSGNTTLSRTLISGNQAASGPEVDSIGVVTADNFNLFGSKGNAGVVGFAPGGSDIVPGATVSVGQIIGALEENGGPTRTNALPVGSPAINAVPANNPGCGGVDQRGVLRPQGTGCDIGAFERQ